MTFSEIVFGAYVEMSPKIVVYGIVRTILIFFFVFFFGVLNAQTPGWADESVPILLMPITV